MLYNYLIFLCIGVYASCKAILNETMQSGRRCKLEKGIQEIQKNFCKIENELDNHLQYSRETPLRIPETQEKACAEFNLKTYVRLLNQITHENMTTHYNNLLRGLELLAGAWPSEDKRDHNCTTTLQSNKYLRERLHTFLLQDLPSFVDLEWTTCPVCRLLKEPKCQ